MSNNLRDVCIGDPFIPCPSPKHWIRNHHWTKSLTLTAPPNASPLAFSHDPTVATTLHELHIEHPIYLTLKPAGAKSRRHWLHDIAVRNKHLRTLTLYGPGPTGFAPQHITPFRISDYFDLGTKTLPQLEITSLTLRHFTLSDAELGQLLKSCPKLTRLELQHVVLVNSPALGPLYGLRELVLVRTRPTAWLNCVLSGVHTLVMKGDVRPSNRDTQAAVWTVTLDEFERLVLGMPLLLTVKVDRITIVAQNHRRRRILQHHGVRQVFNNAQVDLSEHFPKAVVLPYTH
ncbi:hypothetical protein BGZ93_003640 [Podila epicladia]|nr:hypothetical protein BGZ92_003262 [Podila epicladia]KAG0100174.1 hypothetical protein BGZ93_003640 [Podila epicladia]